MFYSILRGPPYDLEIEDGENASRLIAVHIARGNDENRIVSVECELAPTVIADMECSEFSFSIVVFALDDSIQPFRTQQRDTAAPYIPDSVRPSVMLVVCAALEMLVEDGNCGMVYWVTKDRNPHAKALSKYYIMSETLEKAGFSVLEQGTDPFSRRFWTMKR